MKLKYDYFGNTSLRVNNMLYNFEMQIILFDKLFNDTNKNEIWSSNSNLQFRYLKLLQENNLIKNEKQTANLGTKDARVKSAPLENYGFINRKEKVITPLGKEFLELINNQSYKIINDFLQIDLISLFFIKANLNFKKDNDGNFFENYLEIFKIFNGKISNDYFKFLPLFRNFKSIKEFVEILKCGEAEILKNLEYFDKEKQRNFIEDLKNNIFKVDYFKSGKGDKNAFIIIKVLQEFLKFRKNKDNKILENIIKNQEFKDFRIYLFYIINSKKLDEKIQNLVEFCSGDEIEFAERFFKHIFKTRLLENLKDYADLNKRYLKLSGIFEFNADFIEINLIFQNILNHSKFYEILNIIKENKTSKNLLNEFFDDKEFIQIFQKFGIKNAKDLQNYNLNITKNRLENLIKEKFSKEKVIEILSLFDNRKNDDKIQEQTTKDASIATIYEYIISLVWYYIDEQKTERILSAGLSLDNNLLPKSHAVGGEADFLYDYFSHFLMIEATLTEKTNQRRAEMESVSRHLGNLLLRIKEQKREKTYAIFIAPYLDKNVINDFRSRIYCYFENDEKFVKGMKILPLNSQDLIKILKSNLTFRELNVKFLEILNSKNDFGSRWYNDEIQKMIANL